MNDPWLDVWLIRRQEPAAGHGPLAVAELDERERARADRFLNPRGRLLYLSAHIGLRRILARYTGAPPDAIRFTREPCPVCGGPHGRPELAETPPRIRFSLSHSGGLVLVAVAASAVGADLQARPSPATVEACLTALHPVERAELERLPEPGRTAAFARLWTRKEAYLKGTGAGLCRGAASAYLGEGTGDGTEDGSAERPPGWTVIDMGPVGDRPHAAAVAVRGAPAGPVVPRPLPPSFLWAGAARPGEVRSDERREIPVRGRAGAAAPGTGRVFANGPGPR
ncbi:4'-phosphopantetheinyl transferase family protein [Streptomyces sp. NPDC014894]|uniref:4'-phosphopantetheinyl transferase family protein n=1 Tax=Streptomyces sp. NPDC014894 TaxID=3364931 RepID=UPI0036FCF14B